MLLRKMQRSGVRLDGHSLTILLKGCSDNHLKLEVGKQAHAYVVTNQLDFDPFLVTALIDMYSKCGDVAMAFEVFDGSVGRSCSMWNAMIVGFYHYGMWERSLELFVRMRSEGFIVESTTLSSVLMACSTGEAAGFGEGLHCCIVKMGFGLHPYVSTSLVVMYGKFGSVGDAEKVFCGVPNKRTELWNSIISAYIANNQVNKALNVYAQMKLSGERPDSFTLSNVLSACSLVGCWEVGRIMHGELIKRPKLVNMAVQSSLITMYMKNGRIENAGALFASAKDRDLVTWGSMIVGFCQNQNFDKALGLFNQLRAAGLLPDAPIIATVASACTGFECLEFGGQIHGHAIKSGTSSDQFVGSALIDMYSKLGSPQLGGSIFSSLPSKNLVVLNSMISGYGRNGLLNESIGAFTEIFALGLVPDSISITSVLTSVSSFAALKKGKMIHGYQVRNGIICDILVENALLDMYMKCGCLSYAQIIFERMPIRNVISWNTMIAGYGSHGHCKKAIGLFKEMQTSEVLPDDTTFLSLLSSCNHSGLVEEGHRIFVSMRRNCSVVPRMEHYANMVDLLARAGQLNEAYSFIHDMPVKPDESVWLCLLSACRAYRCLDLGELASEQLLKLKPRESGSYTQMLNFYGEMGLLDKAASVRLEMKKAGITKIPGCSWIEMKDSVEVFYSGDSSSLLTGDIHFMLRGLRRTMRDID